MKTSLVLLAGEGSEELSDHLITFREFVAINGAIMIPGVQTIAYQPADARSPAYMIGIANSIRQGTSKLVMQTRKTDQISATDFQAAWAALNAVQEKAAAAVRAQLSLSTARANSADQDTLTKLQTRLTDAEASYETELSKARLALQKPGLVVARFRAGQAAGAEINLGELLRGAVASEEAASGFVLLGNIRCTSLIFGNDYGIFLETMDSDELTLFQVAGLSNFTLEAEYVAYSSSLENQLLAAFDLAVSPNQLKSGPDTLSSIDKIKVTSYFTSIANLSNSGMVGRVDWLLLEAPMVNWKKKVSSEEVIAMGLDEEARNKLPKKYDVVRPFLEWRQVVTSQLRPAGDLIADAMEKEKIDYGDAKLSYQFVYSVLATVHPQVLATVKEALESPAALVVRRGGRVYALIDPSVEAPEGTMQTHTTTLSL